MKVIGPDASESTRRHRIRRLRSVAILPTLLTLGNMLCGFAAIYFSALGIYDAAMDVDPHVKATLNSRFVEAFLPTFISVAGFLVFVGMFFDAMDGRIARMTTGTTNFGAQLDSLADMVTFGIAPAVIMIALVTMYTRGQMTEIMSTKLAWVAGAVFASCCALRLARFNVEHAEASLKHTSFHGLPSPGAAALLVSFIILHEYFAESKHTAVVQNIVLRSLPAIAVVAGLLMVSRIRYVHVSNTYLRGRQPFGYVLLVLIVLAFFMTMPAMTVAGLTVLYVISGPIGGLWRLVTRGSGDDHSTEGEDERDQPHVAES